MVKEINWIQGQKFAKIADFIYTPSVKAKDDYNYYPDTFQICKLKHVNIVYTHTLYVKQLFKIIERLSNIPFIVITHNSDLNIDATYNKPANVLKWWAQNVNVIHQDIESIPIGLENDRWFPEIQKKRKMETLLEERRVYKNLVYLNINVRTNLKERAASYTYFNGKSFVTTHDGKNGIDFDMYIENMYSHHFMVCPQGNGMDTHRFWEALYMGAIPIVKRDLNNRFYNDLPVLFVNEWEEVTESLLSNFLLKRNATLPAYIETAKLDFQYWAKRITGQS